MEEKHKSKATKVEEYCKKKNIKFCNYAKKFIKK